MVNKIIKGIINVLFWLTLVVFLYMTGTWVANDFDKTQMNFLGYAPNLVMSESMEPTILTGDLILSKQIDFEDVQVGDIIVYKHTYENGKYKAIVHRVIEKTDEYLVLKGDNNASRDPWNVYPEDVRAKVVLY